MPKYLKEEETHFNSKRKKTKKNRFLGIIIHIVILNPAQIRLYNQILIPSFAKINTIFLTLSKHRILNLIKRLQHFLIGQIKQIFMTFIKSN